jgi:hypothetical protein
MFVYDITLMSLPNLAKLRIESELPSDVASITES